MKKNLSISIEDFFNTLLKIWTAIQKFGFEVYLFFAGIFSYFLSNYARIDYAFYCFLIITSLDTVTRINAEAAAKKLKFNPFKGYFWAEIKSEGLRDMFKKVFTEYGVYLIISFVIDRLVFAGTITFNVYGSDIKLPVIALYFFSFVEVWSIGENIEESGGINLVKRVLHFLPEKLQKIISPKSQEEND